MGLTAGNPVVGGTVLRRAAMKSPNFATGVSGWAVNQDGSAEFNDVVIRDGEIVSGTELYYSGSPALGNLEASISAVAGVDVYGNVYDAGFAVYGSPGQPEILLKVIGLSPSAVPVMQLRSNVASEKTPAEITLDVLNTGAVNEQLETHFFGPAITQQPDFTEITQRSSAEDKSSPAELLLRYWDANVAVHDLLTVSYNGVNLTGAVFAVKPGTGSSPAVPPVQETWHSFGAMVAGWSNSVGRYRLLPDGCVAVQFQNIGVPATKPADFTTIITAANGLPAAYQPSIICRYASYWNPGGGSESAGLVFNTDGSIQVFGVASTTITRMDLHCIIFPF